MTLAGAFLTTALTSQLIFAPRSRVRDRISISFWTITMEYGGYQIEVVVVPSASAVAGGYHATYSIHRDGDLTCSGTIAGWLSTPADAERTAFAAARQWIDNNGARSLH